ncbi:hypothetical protein NPIL_188911 [Nephila pilipes]|uniref:Uncharacterized protein n=1 Tax=Nephila pilipes TaxID=299642 RepID=A0A8X6MMA3_NEPPI|nr:hypothetical protein NPIL_188911 [Nephila pilipes]
MLLIGTTRPFLLLPQNRYRSRNDESHHFKEIKLFLFFYFLFNPVISLGCLIPCTSNLFTLVLSKVVSLFYYTLKKKEKSSCYRFVKKEKRLLENSLFKPELNNAVVT